MATMSFAEARRIVLDRVIVPPQIPLESVWLTDAMGRVCAEDVPADRDMPPLARSLRDGFAVRSTDLPGALKVTGEIRAGQMPDLALSAGEAISIMTGAILPQGADQVLMKEHATRDGIHLDTTRPGLSGEWISPPGSMARTGNIVVPSGRRIEAGTIAMLAEAGRTREIYRLGIELPASYASWAGGAATDGAAASDPECEVTLSQYRDGEITSRLIGYVRSNAGAFRWAA